MGADFWERCASPVSDFAVAFLIHVAKSLVSNAIFLLAKMCAKTARKRFTCALFLGPCFGKGEGAPAVVRACCYFLGEELIGARATCFSRPKIQHAPSPTRGRKGRDEFWKKQDEVAAYYIIIARWMGHISRTDLMDHYPKSRGLACQVLSL